MVKKIVFVIAILLSFGILSAEKYRISDISYNVTGKTKPHLIERNVEIDKERIFETEESLLNYIRDYKQRLMNTLHFISAEVDFTVEHPDENGISIVHMMADVTDSSHLIIMPYPKYDSNNGFELKIRGRDSNFFGTMNLATGSILYALKQKSEQDTPKHKFGFEFSYKYPFQLLGLEANWANDLSFSYTIGDRMPEWNFRTGLEFRKRFNNRIALEFGLHQSTIGNLEDYEKYGDAIYFKEEANIALPIKLALIDNWNDITYTPKANFEFNWDFDGIHPKNEDLLGPVVSAGHSLSTGRVNWSGNNFRTGVNASISQSIGYDFSKGNNGFYHELAGELKAYKGFIYAGFTADVYAFANFNGKTKEFGSRLRGIRDDQTFRDSDAKALKSRAALVMNFDMPLHLFTLDLSKARNWLTEHLWVPVFHTSNDPLINKFLRLFDLDVQLAPFIDVALFYNEMTGAVFHPKDGFYAAGAEFILFPKYWKSVQFRVSVGFDMGNLLLKNYLNTDWRSDVSFYELSFGVGLHY